MNHIIDFQKKNGLVPDGVIGPKTMAKMVSVWGLKNKTRLSHFLGQCHVETAGFTLSKENMNYSAKRMLQIFKSDFDINRDKWLSETEKAKVNDLLGSPVKTANFVYANQNGNGTEYSGDGWKYRGRGSIQTTGKDNYASLAEYLQDDWVMVEPNIVADKYFWESGLFYFERNNLWQLCDTVSNESITKVSKAVNLGNPNSKYTPNHLVERIKWTNYYYGIALK